MYTPDIEVYNPCGCSVAIEVSYDCECCGTGYSGFTITPCDAHR